MFELSRFDENQRFAFVDYPAVNVMKIADAIKEEYTETPAVFSKMEALKTTYSHFRKIRADGNCYYRALMYGYIEKLITLGGKYIKEFWEKVEMQSEYYKCNDSGTLNIFKGHLKQLDEKLFKEGTEKALQLLFRMMIFSDHFDRSVITWLREALAAFMKANNHVSINGLPLSTAVLGEFDSVDDFVNNSVKKANEEASLLVQVLAPVILRIGVDIAVFDAKDQHRFSVQSYPASDPLNKRQQGLLNLQSHKITLLFKPGHYDLLYAKDYLLKNPILSKYDVGFKDIFDPNSKSAPSMDGSGGMYSMPSLMGMPEMPMMPECFGNSDPVPPADPGLYPSLEDFNSEAFAAGEPSALEMPMPPMQPSFDNDFSEGPPVMPDIGSDFSYPIPNDFPPSYPEVKSVNPVFPPGSLEAESLYPIPNLPPPASKIIPSANLIAMKDVRLFRSTYFRKS